MQITIRHATLSDAEAIALLSGQLGYPCTNLQMSRRLERILPDRGQAVLVAVEGVAVAGWVHVAERLTVESDEHAEILGLVVDSNRRGEGIGASLVRAAEDWAQSRGMARLRVRSNVVRRETHEFYKRLGFADAKQQTVFEKRLPTRLTP